MTPADKTDEPKKPALKLPKYLYARGEALWMNLKREDGKWKRTRTPYTIHQLADATRYLNAMLRGIAMKTADAAVNLSLSTVKGYGEKWLQDREKRGVASVVEERARLEKFVFPHVGDMGLELVRPRHIRDLVHTLRGLKKEDGKPLLAPRTVHHAYQVLHNIYESAIIDEHVLNNPVKVRRGELPKKLDVDPEWRPNATYTLPEVVRLISAPVIPAERRVMNALKALAGLRHGEAAGICWRHLDEMQEPLAKLNITQAWCSRTSKIKATKTETVRAVPVHPTLAKILKAWRTTHWKRVYGRDPTPDDFIVPTRTMRGVSVYDANGAFKRDLDALGLRKEAGSRRDRGGHDLRSWYETQCIEDGGDSLLVRRTTHCRPTDVNGGYERFSWKSLCREIAKLNIELPEGEVLGLITSSSQAEVKAGARWRTVVTPSGLEGVTTGDDSRTLARVVDAPEFNALASRRRQRSMRVITPSHTAGKMIERAVLAGDMPRVLEIARQLCGLY